MVRYLPLLLLFACADGPPTTPETRPEEHPNADNTAIYDVDPDDPYEIDDSSFLDFTPGQPLPERSEFLSEVATPRSGKSSYQRYSLRGERRDTLGYLLVDPTTEHVAEVHITSRDVVTRNGLRIGNTFAEITERLGQTEQRADTVIAMRYANTTRLCFELTEASDISTAKIREIVLRK